MKLSVNEYMKPLIALLIAALVFIWVFPWVSFGIYTPLYKLGTNITNRSWQEAISADRGYKASTDGFSSIIYTETDKDYIRAVHGTINIYLPLLMSEYGLSEAPKVTVIIFPDKKSMYDTIGYASEEYLPTENPAPIGAYGAGVIGILSPSRWEEGTIPEIDAFISEGPLLHELSHLLLDKKTNGNYQEWFSEGTALYYERKYTGGIADNKHIPSALSEPATYKELSQSFKHIEEAERYRKSHELIRFIVSLSGEQALKKIYDELEAGKSFDRVLKDILKDSWAALDKL